MQLEFPGHHFFFFFLNFKTVQNSDRKLIVFLTLIMLNSISYINM